MVLILGRESTIRRKKQKYCRKVLRCFLHCGFLRTWSCRFVAKIQLKLMFELFVPTERLRCPHSSKCSFVARMSCYKIGNSRTPQLDCSRLQSRGTKTRNAFAQGQTWGRLREANQLLARRRYCTASALHTGHCHDRAIPCADFTKCRRTRRSAPRGRGLTAAPSQRASAASAGPHGASVASVANAATAGLEASLTSALVCSPTPFA